VSIKNKLAEIRKFCRNNADQARVRKYARFFTEGYDAYGVDPKLMERQRDLWLRDFGKQLDLEGFLKLGDALVTSGKYEEAVYAIWFAAAFRDQFTPATFERVGRWLDDGFRNWAHVDVFCGEVSSHCITKRIVSPDAMSDWRAAKSKWKRRAVPVTLIDALKIDVPIDTLLAFIVPMMLDGDKPVQQGLGWFLREAWKKHPSAAEKFLMTWKDRCGRLIVQYASEKMSAAKKAKFKKRK